MCILSGLPNSALQSNTAQEMQFSMQKQKTTKAVKKIKHRQFLQPDFLTSQNFVCNLAGLI